MDESKALLFFDEEANYSTNLTSRIPSGSVYTTMLSSIASMFGSFLIILTFLMWKDLRTIARAILVFLAIADFLTALGYVFGAVVYLESKGDYTSEAKYQYLCRFQSFMTTTFPISSFLWTMNLAIYLFVMIVLRKGQLAKKLVIPFHIIAWGIPLAICIPAVSTGVLGEANSRTSVSWCFVHFNDTLPDNSTAVYRQRIAKFYAFEFICGKIWEIIACIVSLVLYIIIKFTLTWRKRSEFTQSVNYGSLNMERKMTAAIIHLDKKLIWIPLVFILLRVWGTLRFFISFHPSCRVTIYNETSDAYEIATEQPCHRILYDPFLVFMQSICDPAQGWGNALIFVLFHQTIIKRLCPCGFTLADKIKRKWHRRRNGKGDSGEKNKLCDDSRSISIGVAQDDSLPSLSSSKVDSNGLMERERSSIVASLTPSITSINPM